MTTQTMSPGRGRRITRILDPEIANLLALLVFVCFAFSVTAKGFLSETTFVSIAFQLPSSATSPWRC